MPRKLQSVGPPADHERAPDLRAAVRDALQAMTWLEDSDGALQALALRQADEIERAVDRGELFSAVLREAAGDQGLYERVQALEAMCNAATVVGLIGPHLLAALKELGGTPKARSELKVDRPVGGRLAQLRAGAVREHDS